jgi:molybdate transport system substrate-binding protein
MGAHRKNLRRKGWRMNTANLRIISAGAARGLLNTVLGPAIDQASSHFGAVGAMQKIFEGGAECDLLLLTRAQIDALASLGQVSNVADVGWVATGLAVRDSNAQAPSVTDRASLKLVLESTSMLYVPDTKQSTAGKHVASMIEQLGLTQQMQGRISEHPNGAVAMKALADNASGQGLLLGCTQASEIIYTSGVKLIGLLPEPFGLSTLYSVAMPARSQQASAAREAASSLLAASAVRQAAGFQ